LLTYDSSFTFPTGGKPADITGIGTSQVTKYIEWYMAASAEKKGVAVSKIEIKINSTEVQKFNLVKVNVPGVGYLDGSSFSCDVLENYVVYTYTIGSALEDCVYWSLPANTNNKFDLTVALEVDLDTDDVLGATITVYQLTPAESTITDTDTVGLSAS